MTKTTDNPRRHSEQLDSSLSVSPTATIHQRNINSSALEAGRAHALQDDRNLVNSGEFEVLFYFYAFRCGFETFKTFIGSTFKSMFEFAIN